MGCSHGGTDGGLFFLAFFFWFSVAPYRFRPVWIGTTGRRLSIHPVWLGASLHWLASPGKVPRQHKKNSIAMVIRHALRPQPLNYPC